MAFDSTANLLFNIGANSDEAEGNIARFRSLLSKDLAGMGAEFSGWSEEVLGEIGRGNAERATLRTGIAAEDMSALMYAGKVMGIEYEALVGGLTKFSSYIVKSASDT